MLTRVDSKMQKSTPGDDKGKPDPQFNGPATSEGAQLTDSLGIRHLHGFRLALYKLRVKIGLLMQLDFEPLYDYGTFRLGRKYMVKHGLVGARVRPTEALAMEFIRRNTTIPVPRVYEVLGVEGSIHIVQEYIQGDVLEDVWHKLTLEEQRNSMRDLRGYLDQLRWLTPPHPGRVEAVDGTGCLDERLSLHEWGPFDTCEDFNRHFYHETIREHPEIYPLAQEPLAKTHGRTWRTVFAHGDLGPHNILWRNGRIVALIDWERSGWFPEYWEYTRTFFPCGFTRTSWWNMYNEFVDRYPDELEVEKVIAHYFVRI